MDAQRTAEARIEQVERRLTALQETGVDTAGLASRLDLARAALAQGRAEEVPLLCEDLLAEARRVVDGGATATRTPRPVRTDRFRTPPADPTPAPPTQPALDQRAPPDTQVLRDRLSALLQPHLLALEGRLEERLAALEPVLATLSAQAAQRPGIDPSAIEQAVTTALARLTDEQEQRFTAEETRVRPALGLPEDQVRQLVDDALRHVRTDLLRRMDDRLGELAPLVERVQRHLDQPPGPDLAALGQAIEQAVAPLVSSLQAQVEDRFTRLAAQETRTHLRPGLDEPHARRLITEAVDQLRGDVDQRLATLSATLPAPGLEERLVAALDGRIQGLGDELHTANAQRWSELQAQMPREDHLIAALDRRLEARLAAVTAHTAMAVEDLRTEVQRVPPATPATVRVAAAVAAAVPEATAAAVDEAVAPLEGKVDQRLTDMAQTMASVEARLGDLATGLDARVEQALGERIAQAMDDHVQRLDTTIADAVRTALAQAPTPAAPLDVAQLRDHIVTDLQADLDFQLEQMAAQRGWVSINDVRAELAHRGPASPSSEAPAASPQGLARLETALVEFVRQTQSQQEQFLAVLQERVVRSTQALAQRALTGIAERTPTPVASPSSELLSAPTPQQALDPLLGAPPPADDAATSAHSTQLLASLARGAPLVPHADADLDTDLPHDPDLPPADALDPLATVEDVAPPATHPPTVAKTLSDTVLTQRTPPPLARADTALPPTVPDDGNAPGDANAWDEALTTPTDTPTEVAEAIVHEATHGEAPAPAAAPTEPITATLDIVIAEDVLNDDAATPEAPMEVEAAASVVADEQTSQVDTMVNDLANTLDQDEVRAAAAPLPAAWEAPEPEVTATDEVATLDAPQAAATAIQDAQELDPVASAVQAAAAFENADTQTFDATTTRAHASEDELPPVQVETPLAAPPEAATATAANEETAAMGAPEETAASPATPPTTKRHSLSDLETVLRRLIRDEVDRRLAEDLPQVQAAVHRAMAHLAPPERTTDDEQLRATVHALVTDALQRQTPDPAKDLAALAELVRSQATAKATTTPDLRDAVLTLLRDADVRQAVLEIVAVEAISNPGPLAELTGLRAFIRREVRQAATIIPDDLPSEVATDSE